MSTMPDAPHVAHRGDPSQQGFPGGAGRLQGQFGRGKSGQAVDVNAGIKAKVNVAIYESGQKNPAGQIHRRGAAGRFAPVRHLGE